MAKKIECQTRSSGGTEATLDAAALYLFLMGLLSAIILVFLLQFAGIAFAAINLTISFIGFHVLKALAELIRIAKKSAEIPYSGQISQGKSFPVFKCSDCKAILRSGLKCDSCGAQIDID